MTMRGLDSILKTVMYIHGFVSSVLPFRLPNEVIGWWRYNRRFSGVCDGCNDKKGTYTITYQHYEKPQSLIIPFGVRLCPECLAKADSNIGIMEESDEKAGDTFRINRV